jgi:RNA polymerase sigma-70 factor (ECF subfamily)
LITDAPGTGQSLDIIADSMRCATPGGAAAPGAVEAAADPADAGGALDFAEVYQAHFDFAWRTIRRLGVPAGQVDDVVQDVFLVVARRLPSFDPERSHPRSWLYGVITRVVLNDRRRQRRKDRPCLPLDDPSEPSLASRIPSTAPGPLQAAEEQEALRLASAILETLPEDRRELLILADLEEMPIVEAAESLGINVNTAHSRLRTARREFDEALARFRARDERRKV